VCYYVSAVLKEKIINIASQELDEAGPIARGIGFIACVGANIYLIRQGYPDLVDHGFNGGFDTQDALMVGGIATTGLGAHALVGKEHLKNVLKGEDPLKPFKDSK